MVACVCFWTFRFIFSDVSFWRLYTEHNSKKENADSQNIFITGDNLEALRHLQNAYVGKVKMIYIDPPYNTGKEFVYNDHFEFTDENLKLALGYSDEEIERLKSIQGKSSHSAWLTFMYPRLKLAQKLLTDDGVIFVSIDDNEQANLKLLMDDVFWEGNFIAGLIHQRAKGGGQAKYVVKGHDYILSYAKEIKDIALARSKVIQSGTVERNGELYLRNDDVLRKTFGKYNKSDGDRRCFYEQIEQYHGVKKKAEIDEQIKSGELVLEPNKEGYRAIVKYEKASEATSKLYSIIKVLSEKGKEDMETLNINVFDYPKPVDLIKELVSAGTYKDSIILDFFAGSATTAHAVMQLNAENNGNRKFIMVQLDEETNKDSETQKAGYKTIEEIGRERIKRAAAKIKSENPIFAGTMDLGFKHYRLTNTTAETLDKIIEFDPTQPQQQDFFENMIDKLGGLDAILTTWLIDGGNTFDTKIEEVVLSDYTAHYVTESKTLYLISEKFTTEALKAMLNKIGAGELPVSTIVVYPYSFGFEVMREIENNVKNNLDNAPTIIKRY